MDAAFPFSRYLRSGVHEGARVRKDGDRPEGFTWRWERLVPGALTLYRFPLKTQKADLTIQGYLPSGEVYSSLAPEKPGFSFEIGLSVLYRLRPETLAGLAESARLRPEGLADLYDTLIQEMKGAALESALTAAGAQASAGTGTSLPSTTDIVSGIAREFPRRFSHVEFVSLTPTVNRMPDFALYQMLRNTYLQVAAAREDTLKTAAVRLANQEAEQKSLQQKQEQTLSLLEKYGQLLDKYPVLIKFLFLTATKGFSTQDLQTLDLLDKLGGLE
jgi:hypothetical protein